jgi:hypothetical protein
VSTPDKLIDDFKELLIDIGSPLAPPNDEGEASVKPGDVGANKLFAAIYAARHGANGSYYSSELVSKWDNDAEKIEALIGTIKEAAKDAATLIKVRAVGGLEVYEWPDNDFDPPQVLKLCTIPARFLDDSVKKRAGGTNKPAALEAEFALKVIKALTELHDEGIHARIVSGYRTLAAQIAAAKTNPSAADGNTSNHRRGVAIDLSPEGSRTNPRVLAIMNKNGLYARVAGSREDNHWSKSGR